MNIFLFYKDKIRKLLIVLKNEKLLKIPDSLNNLTIEIPPKNLEGDISCNAALILSKINKKKPKDIAEILVGKFKNEFREFKIVSIAEAGFINIIFHESFWEGFLNKVQLIKEKYGSISYGNKKRYLVEFVSANPTGPLHVGHCRGAIIGDVISNILKFNGNLVTKEYYINDYGSQVENFNLSVYYRILEIVKKQDFPNYNKNLYPGNYVIQIASDIIKKKLIKSFDNYKKISKKLKKFTIEISIRLIKQNLLSLGVIHDTFVKESKFVESKEVQKTIEKLKNKNFLYLGKINAPKIENIERNDKWKEREQLLFKSTLFGDDKDRALQKEDLSWTYFASDLAYHNNKIERNYDHLINILGADHAGYILRIKAGVKALSESKNELICKISQLVKLVKDGKPFKMSKRKGDYVTVENLIEEVGRDAVRFIMLSRSNDVELEFDFKKITEKSKENPLYYVQYCYARICSVFRNLNIDMDNEIKIETNSLNLNKYEKEIVKKISEWPKCLEISQKKLEPHRIPIYLYELSSLFHSYWTLGKDNALYKFINEGKPASLSKLMILKSVSYVIKSGMDLIGVSTPKKM